MGIRKRERHGSKGYAKNTAATDEGGGAQSKGAGSDTKRKRGSDIPLAPAEADAKQGGPRERITTKKWNRDSTSSSGRIEERHLGPGNECGARGTK